MLTCWHSAREAVALEQPRRVRIRRRLEDAVRPDDQRRAFAGIDRLDRLARFLLLEDQIFDAVGLHRALAERELLRRHRGGLHLQHVLLGELLEITPAEIACRLEGRRQNGAAVARMRLDDLVLPLRQQQIGEALRRFFLFHQASVVGDDAQEDAEAGIHAVRILVLGRIELGDVFRHVRREKALLLPIGEMRSIRGIDDVDGMDAARIFLADALQDTFGAGPLDLHFDAGIFGLEASARFPATL